MNHARVADMIASIQILSWGSVMRFDVLSGVCLALAWLLSLPETWAENGQTSQEEKPPIFWGEISEKGFQVGYRLYPESGIVDPGESLKVQFVLKNISRYPRCRSFALSEIW